MEVIPGNDTWTQCRSQQVMVKLSHNRCICITAPASVAQGISWKRGQEDCKSQNARKSAVKAPGSGCITKTGAMACSGALTWEGKSHVVTPLRTAGNSWLLGEGGLPSSRDDLLLVIQCRVVSLETVYTPPIKAFSVRYVFTYMYVCNNNKKEALNLERGCERG